MQIHDTLSRFIFFAALGLIGLLASACEPDSDFEQRMEQARTLAAEGKFEELIPILTPMHYERPRDPELNHLYGLTLLKTNNGGMAVWPLRVAAFTPGREVEDGLLLARALGNGSVPMDAIVALDRVLEFYPDSSEAIRYRATINNGLRNHEEMLIDCENLMKLFEHHTEGFFCKVEALMELDRFEDAEELMAAEREIQRLEGGGRPMLERRMCLVGAELATEAEDLETARTRWESCLEVARPSKDLLSAAVKFFDQVEDQERGTEVLVEALAKSNEDFELLSNVQMRFRGQGREEEAEALLIEATGWKKGSHRAWIALADLYRRQENFIKAIEAMESTLRQNSDAGVPTLTLAQYADDLIQMGQFEKADAVIEQLPDHPMVIFLRARSYLERGEAAAALAHFEEGLVGWPGNTTARYLSGQAAEQLGDMDRAIEEYRNALRSGAGDTEAGLDLARILEAEWNLPSAVKALQYYLDEKPRDAEAFRMLLRIGVKSGRPDLVNSAIAGLSNIPSEAVTYAMALAEVELITNGLQAAADSILQSDLDLESPENAEALGALSQYWIQLGRGEEALARIRTMLDQHPNEGALHELHGSILSLSKESPERIKASYERALELEPDRVTSLVRLADFLVGEGKSDSNDAAIALYDRVLELELDHSEAAWKAVELLSGSEDDTGIEARLMALLVQNPIHVQALSLRAERLMERGEDLGLAETLSERALRFGGGLDAAILRARVALAQGEGAKGYEILERVETAGPNTPSRWYALGLAFEEAGDPDRARTAFENALEYKDWDQLELVRADLARLPSQKESKGE